MLSHLITSPSGNMSPCRRTYNNSSLHGGVAKRFSFFHKIVLAFLKLINHFLASLVHLASLSFINYIGAIHST